MTVAEKTSDINLNINETLEIMKQLFLRWQYVKIAVTVVLIWYAYYQIKRFNNAEGDTVDEIIKNQNKVKFQTKILIGSGNGILTYFSMLWSGTILGLIFYYSSKK